MQPREHKQRVHACVHHATSRYPNKKRLMVFCDGTWNNSNIKGAISTNVSRLSGAVSHRCCTGMPQIVFYCRGPGTEESKVAQYLGGILGKGVIQDIADVYRFICDNYNPGDEIVLIGFSRGAFVARSVAGVVCDIGLLNRAGLARFGDVFHDYQNFPSWKSGTKFNKEEHLLAFSSIANVTDEERKKHFDHMRGSKGGSKGQAALEEMAKKYQKLLSDYNLSLQMKEPRCGKANGKKKGGWVLHNVTIKAIGVWDTVGSLGWPAMPWNRIHRNRSTDELRFTSLDVHHKIEYAFHALALDEWRTAFRPTMWSKAQNDRTHLRQVWFPGSHSDVGGGLENQQIATIALAWMADQLTSVGVEFSFGAMKNIFEGIDTTTCARPWGKGKISNPSGITVLPDKVWNKLCYPFRRLRGRSTVTSMRTPGMYEANDRELSIQEPNELIHPCARLRYLYDGLGPDDDDDWKCTALTESGFELTMTLGPCRVEGQIRQRIASEYETFTGKVMSVYHVDLPIPSNNFPPRKIVHHELPREDALQELEPARVNWAWIKDDKILPEERIGDWERMFMKINHDRLDTEKSNNSQRRLDEEQSAKQSCKESLSPWIYDNVQAIWAAASNMVKGTTGRLVVLWKKPHSKVLKPKGYPWVYDYHDLLQWQQGDPRRQNIQARHR